MTYTEKLWSRINRRGPNECWEWKNPMGGKKKFPVIQMHGRNKMANRVVYELLNGPIPDDSYIFRECKNSMCCNPAHARIGNPGSNLWNKVKKGTPEECWEWQGYKRRGYGKLYCKGRGVVSAHRLSYELANGPIPSGLYVCHKCDNRACCNPSHFFLGTAFDNYLDSESKGRRRSGINPRRGESHPHSKLRDRDIFEIRKLINLGVTQRKIGERFGVAQTVISKIVNGDAWRHLS